MKKPGKISGFPEWLPAEKLLEDEVIATIKRVYTSFGFTPIETPAVELLSTLVSQGADDKEIFTLRRHGDESDREAELALHFDLSVPFARYVAQHFSELQFPFKRYQLQKVWRGERPQKGRSREFYQFDIDIVAQDVLPLACDAEVFTGLERAFRAIDAAPYVMWMNSRKVLCGVYQSLGLDEVGQKRAIIAVDKLDKIGPDGVRRELEPLGLNGAAVDRILEVATLKFPAAEAAARLGGLGVQGELFDQGAGELIELLGLIPESSRRSIEINLSLARGLAYYTGAIAEVRMRDYMEYGSLGGGGRYDNLTGDMIDRKLPAVGASVGLTRLMEVILHHKLKPLGRRCPTDLLVTVYAEEQRAMCNEVADRFRESGLSVEVFYRAPKLGRQIDYADAKGIPCVAFVQEGGVLEVKDLRTKEQRRVEDPAAWSREYLAAKSR